MIVSQFEEYKSVHEICSKPELILYWVRNSVTSYNHNNSYEYENGCNMP